MMIVNIKKGKGMKKCVIKRRLMFENYTENIDEHNVDKENKILIVFDDMIANMISNGRLDSIVTELFIRGKKLNVSLVFITQ